MDRPPTNPPADPPADPPRDPVAGFSADAPAGGVPADGVPADGVPVTSPGGAPAGPSPSGLPDRLRRRLDDVFGEVLPDVTRDEATDGDRAPERDDDWLRANRPPHHDDRG